MFKWFPVQLCSAAFPLSIKRKQLSVMHFSCTLTFYHLKLSALHNSHLYPDQHWFPQCLVCLSTCCMSALFRSPWAQEELTFSYFVLTLGPDIYQLFIALGSASANLNVSHHGNSLLSPPGGCQFQWPFRHHPRYSVQPALLCSTL